MDRNELERFIFENYAVKPDYPWMGDSASAVFRHRNNGKWFALIMDIPRNKVGLNSCEIFSVVNLKCDPMMVGSLRKEQGIFPAYHMNKENWITVALDGSASDDQLIALLEMSYTATETKKHLKGKHRKTKSVTNEWI